MDSLDRIVDILDQEVERWKFGTKTFERIMTVRGNIRSLIMIHRHMGIKCLINCKYWPTAGQFRECFYRPDQASRDRLTLVLNLLNSVLACLKSQSEI
jgi:hypothetical protein